MFSYLQGMAFSLEERQILGVHGLLPPAILDQCAQVKRLTANLKNKESNLEKHVYLTMLQVGKHGGRHDFCNSYIGIATGYWGLRVPGSIHSEFRRNLCLSQHPRRFRILTH